MEKEQLYKFVDAIINDDIEAAKIAFHNFSVEKTKTILGLQQSEADEPVTESEKIFEEFKQQLVEFIGNDSPIRLDGDYVLVKGKKVGLIKNDLNDIDSGINFVTLDGSFSKEFNSAEDLYKFLMQRYGVKG
jgi:hypothetical protein